MPWKLGDPNERTVKIEVRLPHSLKEWLKAQPEGISEKIRWLVERAKKRTKRP